MERELIIPQPGRAAVAGRRRRAVITIRIALVFLVAFVIAWFITFYLAILEEIPFDYVYASVAVLCPCMGLVVYLSMKLSSIHREVAMSSMGRTRRWATQVWRRLMGRRVGISDAQDNPIPVVDESMGVQPSVEPPNASERVGGSPHDEEAEERLARATEDAISRLATCLVRVHSDPVFKMARQMESMPESVMAPRRSFNTCRARRERTESLERVRRSRGVTRGDDAERSNIEALDLPQHTLQVPRLFLPRPEGREPVRRSVLASGEVSRPDLETLDVQRLPDPTQRWYLPRPQPPIPEVASELSIRHPVQRPGLPVSPWQETPVTEFSTEDIRLSSASTSERSRHGQSIPTDSTTVRPLQQTEDDFAPPPVLSELGRRVGILPARQSRHVTSDVGGKQITRHFLREDPQIPGAVYEQGEESNNPVLGQDLARRGRPTQDPCPSASQREPDSHLPVSSLGERPTQGPCPLVSQRQHGPSQISPRRPRPSQGQGSETTQRQQEPSQESENPTKETLF